MTEACLLTWIPFTYYIIPISTASLPFPPTLSTSEDAPPTPPANYLPTGISHNRSSVGASTSGVMLYCAEYCVFGEIPPPLMDWSVIWILLFAFSPLRFRKYHFIKTASNITMAPKAAPTVRLPAMTPALGVLELLVGTAVGVTVTVTALRSPVTAEAGPLLPVSLRIPARAVVSPAEVNRMVSIRELVLSLHLYIV